jgi:hypothetical protein
MTSNLGEIRGLAGFQIADVASAEICRRVLSAHSSGWRPLVPTRLAQSEFTGEHFPYDAFDRLPTTPIAVGGGTLNVGFAPGEFALPRSALMAWLEKSAKAVSVYFGKFPVASAKVLIVPASGSGVQRGTTFGYRGAAIRLAVGSDSTEADLAETGRPCTR